MKKGIIGLLSLLAGAGAGAAVAGRNGAKKTKTEMDYAKKHLELFLMMNQWVKVKQEGKNLASYFKNNGYKKIAVYGMSYAGETLISELQGTDIQVMYGIDKKADSMFSEIEIYSMSEVMNKAEIDDVDAIVVTAITYFDEIEEKLSTKTLCPIVSLEDILHEV